MGVGVINHLDRGAELFGYYTWVLAIHYHETGARVSQGVQADALIWYPASRAIKVLLEANKALMQELIASPVSG